LWRLVPALWCCPIRSIVRALLLRVWGNILSCGGGISGGSSTCPHVG
jgi:hypothetical protein